MAVALFATLVKSRAVRWLRLGCQRAENPGAPQDLRAWRPLAIQRTARDLRKAQWRSLGLALHGCFARGSSSI